MNSHMNDRTRWDLLELKFMELHEYMYKIKEQEYTATANQMERWKNYKAQLHRDINNMLPKNWIDLLTKIINSPTK
jgi:hypothetical protein